jgi:glyoxylase I family protein
LEKTFQFVKNGEIYGFYAGAGNATFVEVFSESEQVEDKSSIIHHLCLEVEDLDTAITEIRSKGWEISDKKFGSDRSWQAWISDPSGIQIELMQYTAESSQFTGKACEVDW